MYQIDIDELTERICDFYLDYAPFSFVQDSPEGTLDSARRDIARMLSTKEGRQNLTYSLSESIKTDMIPELPYDDSIQEYIVAAQDLISQINELK